ncbi:MAG TPA: glutathione S-transferase family protein [Kofleriaceae bacterium]
MKLYFHPLSSFCHKALIALYEAGVAFEPVVVNLGDPAERAAFAAIWPFAKFPVLVDGDRVIPESTSIIEYLGTPVSDSFEIRAMDRFFDLHIHMPMQKIVADVGKPDANCAAAARAQIETAYDVLESRLGSGWAVGESFSMADCAAAPALFYGDLAVPFGPSHPRCRAYLDRLMARPSYARVLSEAKPFFHWFPLHDRLAATYPAL